MRLWMTPPGTRDHLTDVFFADLKLPHSVRAGIAGCGFVRATPIQAATLPRLLDGRDVAAQAQTGTGKTAAYLISVLTRLVETREPSGALTGAPRALVIAPTRELAVQIRDDARQLSHFTGVRIVTVFGGLDYARQRDELRAGCDLLIGTPGRLLDYEEQGATSFGAVRSLVIDEADRLFDLGFIKDLRRILRHCPPPERRHSMLFSATLSVRVMELAYSHMNSAEKIEIRPDQVTADRVTQVLYHVSSREKLSLLLGILKAEGLVSGNGATPMRTMLFINTKRFAERVVRALERHGHRVGALTGDLPQARRLRILQEFRSGKLSLLVATDVASRGLHIDGVTHVINVDLPQDPEDYVHRIGRTARAGRSGKAISLACEEYVYSLDAIQRLVGAKIPVAHAADELYMPVMPPRLASPPNEAMASGGPRHGTDDLAGDDAFEAEEPSEAPEAAPEDVRAALESLPPDGVALGVESLDDPIERERLRASLAPYVDGFAGDGVALTLDFWTREAFGLEPPVGEAVIAEPEAPRKKKRRRRRAGSAGAGSAGAGSEGAGSEGAGSAGEGAAVGVPESIAAVVFTAGAEPAAR